MSSTSEQTPSPEQAIEDIPEVPTQEQQSAQSTNVPDHRRKFQ